MNNIEKSFIYLSIGWFIWSFVFDSVELIALSAAIFFGLATAHGVLFVEEWRRRNKN